MYRHILLHTHHPVDKTRAHLLCGALFFAMHSCEYSKTPDHAEKRTITIRIRDIALYKKCHSILLTDITLHLTDSIAIIFHLQKRSAEVGETIAMHRTQYTNLNPVAHWTYTVRQVMAILKWQTDRLVNTFTTTAKWTTCKPPRSANSSKPLSSASTKTS